MLIALVIGSMFVPLMIALACAFWVSWQAAMFFLVLQIAIWWLLSH